MSEGGVIAFFIGGTSFLLVSICVLLDTAACHSQASAMGLERTYGPLQGCIVVFHGERVPISAVGVRVIEERK